MKRIEAVIRPEKLDAVKSALDKAGIAGLTVTEVRGRGVQKGITYQWKASQYTLDLIPKVKIEVVVKDSDESKVVEAITAAARTGAVGDGKIFITDIADVVRVRTGEKGEKAV